MSIIVSVKINDGVVMAADSATSFACGQVYEHGNKLVNLVKGLPIGVMTCGIGGIGNASVATLLKDLRGRLSGDEAQYVDWAIDRQSYTMALTASRVRDFFAERTAERTAQEEAVKGLLLLRICGYSSGRPLPEVWQVATSEDGWSPPMCIQDEAVFGVRWDGEYELLNRLILGVGTIPDTAAKALGLTREQVDQGSNTLRQHMYENLILPAAPIQDAIDLARFMVETTKGFIRFAVARSKTVGGPIEIAAITKHEGFKWVQRKHFFPAELNQ
jgi:hypothetical protein